MMPTPHIRRCALGVLLGALLATLAPAAPPLVRTYTEQDGLPSPAVADVMQGADGRMWFLTDAGVAAYDGATWEVYGGTDGGPFRRGFGFELDERGHGWAVDHEGRFFSFDGRSWTARSRPQLPGMRHTITSFAVVPTSDGAVPCFGTIGAGLFLREDGIVRNLGRENGLPSDTVRALLAVGDELLLGTDAGLWSWREGRIEHRYTPPAGLSREIWGLALDAAGAGPAQRPRIWVQGRDWVGVLEGDEFSPVSRRTESPALTAFHRLVLEPDLEGGLYYGNGGGLFHLRARSGRVELLNKDEGLVGGGAFAFERDREGNLWIATYTGVSKIANTIFSNLDGRDGLLEDEVASAIELPDGEIVLGHNHGLTFYRPLEDRMRTLPLSSPTVADPLLARVLDMELDAEGALLVALSGHGLARVKGNHVTWIGGGGPPHNWIWTVRRDPQGRIWCGGPAGLFRFERGRLVHEPIHPDDQLRVRRLFRGARDTFYVATSGHGLFVRDGRGWRRATGRGGENNVFAVLEDSRGAVLVGTQAGLRRLEGEALVRTGLGTLAIDRPVYFIVEDRSQRLWAGTNYGVFRWSGQVLEHFTVRDGLAGLETNRAAALVDREGRVWLGTDRGISVHDPRRAEHLAAPPTVELLSLTARGEALPADQRLELGPDGNDLTFHLRAISFRDESRVEFRTRLEGLEGGWETAISTTRLDARYPRVPPGSYRLVAQARGAQGVWGPALRSAEIVVTPPVWQRGWFFGLIAAALALLGFVAHTHLAQRRYATRLEQEVRRRTEELELARLSESAERERLAIVLGSVGDGVIAVDSEERVTLINAAAKRLVGVAPGKGEGRSLEQVLRGYGDLAPLRELLREAPEGPQPGRVIALTPEDGGGAELEVAAAPYHPPGAAGPGTVLALRNVSERRRLEQEMSKTRRLEALGVLAGGIAHDFNNLLTAILGNVSLVRSSPALEQAAHGRLEDAEKALGRAHRLARQLITFARGGAPVTEPASIGDLLRESSRFVFRGSSVGCTMLLRDDLWAVEVDSDQIHQVFENLFLNARQAIGHGGRIEITGKNVEADDADRPPTLGDGRYVRIDVRDSGSGIRREDLEHIFEPYFTTKSHGSGLGLATSYSIVKRHGGTISVRSVPGVETVFSVYLPATEREPAAARRSEPALPGSSGRVLVLEDESFVGNVLRDMLGHLGYEAHVVPDGRAALERCAEELSRGVRFDAAILDLTVPGGLGGAEVLPRLLSLDPELKAIASSGYSESPVMARHAEFGFKAVLPKPYTLAAVGKVLRGVLAPAKRTSVP